MTSPTDTRAAIAVLGPGSWGTALAILLTHNGHDVRLWGHAESIRALAADAENKHYLPGIPLPPAMRLEPELAQAVKGADEILVVIPSHAFREVVSLLPGLVADHASISWATKGFDPTTGMLLSEVAEELLPGRNLAVISGPTFAAEVARGLPTAITVASPDTGHARRVADYLHSETFRAYTANDMIGVQVGGATKNVMAIAAGISDGLGFGANARIALMTRGLAEITRLGLVLGAHAETFMGLAGLGDLALTCTDNQSRNRRMGLALAKGLSIDEARAQIQQEVEGVNTAREVYHKAAKLGVDMPITREVYRILYEGLDPRQAVKDLLHRQQKPESD
ncbi:MAG: NAD(P)H-dependent glycerol-3-phosphate dehydrogenase [Pseudomonadota bacterium]